MNIFKSPILKIYSLLDKKVKQTNWYQNQIDDKSQYPTNDWYRTNLERNFDIVNIGSSSALYAFDYDSIGINGFNWAWRPRSLELGYKIFKNFFSILGPKGILCIPLGPFTGLKVPWTGTKEEERLFGIMDPSLFADYNSVARKMRSPLRSRPKIALKRLLKDEKRQDIHSVKQLTSNSEFDADALQWINIWKSEFNISDLQNDVPEHLLDGMRQRCQLMSEIIDFCLERDIVPVVVLPPVHKSLGQYFTPEFVSNYLSPILSAADNKGATILNMLQSHIYSDSDFYNSFFLNPKGASKFMSDLLNQIQRNQK